MLKPGAPSSPPVVLLGPQRLDPVQRIAGAAPDVGAALAELGVREQVAIVTAGWQEREGDDAALREVLGVPAENLRLHARSQEVFTEDRELTTAYQARQELLRHLQSFYRIRLDRMEDAAKAISVRHVDARLIEEEWRVSVATFRQLDDDHLVRCRAIHDEFDARWRPLERAAIARHRHELRAILERSEAVVIAGGHVASLLNRLRLFDVVGLAVARPLVAWSAGAMVLTDRIVLFHDYPPYGSDLAQLLDEGHGRVPGLVVLPDAGRRVRQDDRGGISRFAQRMAPAVCATMDPGSRITWADGRLREVHSARLTTTGGLDRSWAP